MPHSDAQPMQLSTLGYQATRTYNTCLCPWQHIGRTIRKLMYPREQHSLPRKHSWQRQPSIATGASPPENDSRDTHCDFGHFCASHSQNGKVADPSYLPHTQFGSPPTFYVKDVYRFRTPENQLHEIVTFFFEI